MPRYVVAVLALLLASIAPAAADPASDWLRTVVRSTQALARHPDLVAAATTYDQRLTVRFDIGRDGRAGRVTVRRDRATREAAERLRRLVQGLRFAPPPRAAAQRSFTQPVNIARKQTAEELAGELSRRADELNRQAEALRKRYGIPSTRN